MSLAILSGASCDNILVKALVASIVVVVIVVAPIITVRITAIVLAIIIAPVVGTVVGPVVASIPEVISTIETAAAELSALQGLGRTALQNLVEGAVDSSGLGNDRQAHQANDDSLCQHFRLDLLLQ